MPTEVVANDPQIEEAGDETSTRPNEGEEQGSSSSDNRHPGLRRQTSIQREFVDAIVRLAPLEELKILLNCGAELSTSVTQGLTPLHYAVWQQYPEAAEFLIEEGCDINARDDIGYSPLHLSAEHGYIDVMKVLLKHEAQVNFYENTHSDYPMDMVDEPLRLALKHDHYEAAKLLLEHDANTNVCYFFGHDINLISPYNTRLMGLLLSYGADANARDRQSFSPLMKACRMHQDPSDEFENRETISGREILQHFAQTFMGLETVLLLVSFGADVNLRTDHRHDNRSVLHYAVLSGSVPIVNLLIKQGAKVNLEETYRKPSPLDLAILKGDVAMIKLLMETGANVNSSSPIIGCPLHMACSDGIKNRLEILKLLLEAGADPNQVIFNDVNEPLRPVLGEYLSSNEELDTEVVNLLIRYGAQVIMQSQSHNLRGILNSVPSPEKHPRVLSLLMSAAYSFDLPIIRSSSRIEEKKREMLLKAGQTALSLKHLTRVYLRKHLAMKLPQKIDELDIPTILKKYLLYEIS